MRRTEGGGKARQGKVHSRSIRSGTEADTSTSDFTPSSSGPLPTEAPSRRPRDQGIHAWRASPCCDLCRLFLSTARVFRQTMTRPKVPDDKRIRTAQACESCKRRKQKVRLFLSRILLLPCPFRSRCFPCLSSPVPNFVGLATTQCTAGPIAAGQTPERRFELLTMELPLEPLRQWGVEI